MLSNRTYNIIKYLVTIYLPLVGAIYFGLAETVDFERTPGVNGVINAIVAAASVLLARASAKYQKKQNAPDGELYVVHDPDGEGPHLKLSANSTGVMNKDKVQFEVKHVQPEYPSE
jgi:hypothetical protein